MHMVMPGAIFKKRALIEFIRAQLQEKNCTNLLFLYPDDCHENMCS